MRAMTASTAIAWRRRACSRRSPNWSAPMARMRSRNSSRDLACARAQRRVLGLARQAVSPDTPYGFSVSRNRTGSPDDGVTNSPCHITRLPRTKVPTGQPVTRIPS